MNKLKLNPTPAEFAKAWSQEYESALNAVAKNGEVDQADTYWDHLGTKPSVFADNAEHWLNRFEEKNQVSEMVKAGYKYALKNGKAVAGSDGKIALEEAVKMAGDLVEDFYFLSGKTLPAPGPNASAALKKAVQEAYENAEYESPTSTVAKKDYASLPFFVRRDVEAMKKAGSSESSVDVVRLVVAGENTYGVLYADSDGSMRFSAFTSAGARIARAHATESSGNHWG